MHTQISLTSNKWGNSKQIPFLQMGILQMGLLPLQLPHTNGASEALSSFFHLGRMASLYNQKTISISSRATILDFSKGAFKNPSMHATKVHSSFISLPY
jgi:hypothetical protein